MLFVNQANDHGEIIVAGIADAVAYEAEGRVEARLEQRCRHRRRTAKFLPWAEPGAYQRRASASHGLLAPMTRGHRCVTQPRAALVHVYR